MPLLCQQGVAGSIPATSTRTTYVSGRSYFSRFCNLRCNSDLLFCSTDFWSIWSNNGLRQIETEAHSLGLCEAKFKLFAKV
jgi:hypothetical protein